MSYTVGFDFGTHQTKICIKDSTNPAEKIFEFLEFEKPDGSSTVLFPSIVQINNDHTLSYGFCNEDECLFSIPPEIEEPVLELLPMPRLEMPEFDERDSTSYPHRPSVSVSDLKNLNIEDLSPLEIWVNKCDKLDLKLINEWKEKGLEAFKSYLMALKNTLHRNVLKMADYEVTLEELRLKSLPRPLRFRYFKQAALTSPEIWQNEDFSSTEISIWYITYILILLKERLGEGDFSVQFGVPCGASNTPRDKNITFKAYRLFISAADLADQFKNIDEYLSMTFEELREKTEYKVLSPTTIDEYYFDDIPEAFAGLVSVTTQKKLWMGFHLLVDIGGGTTDLALFTVSDDHTPNVHSVVSFPAGLNFIFELRQNEDSRSMEEIQNDFFNHSVSKGFKQPVKHYKALLKKEGEKACKAIIQAFSDSYYHHGMKMSKLLNALKFQPILYCGGGSAFSNLYTPIGDFSDIRKLNKEMLDIRNLKNESRIEKNLYPILSISYGLASFEKGYDQKIECVDLSQVFQTFLPKAYRDTSHNHYEHGLTDIE